MIVVMQCAGTKRDDAGFMRTKDGRRVFFVADPKLPPADDLVYARPDDPSDAGPSWRELLLRYNETGRNDLGLARAFELYRNDIYRQLAEHVGVANLYILSAGWGLIPARFLTPQYDITFTAAVKKKAPYKLRRKADRYDDFRLLPADTSKPIVLFGSKEYASLFAALTAEINAPKTVFYRSNDRPDLPGCRAVEYRTSRSTNWQYECASAFLDGKLDAQIARSG